jgi:hypothetical protein
LGVVEEPKIQVAATSFFGTSSSLRKKHLALTERKIEVKEK